MLRCRALDSNNLKYEGEGFLASCAALMEQFSVPAGDMVESLESSMFELANGKVNPVSAVSGRHIDAVRRQLEKKRKQEEQYDPVIDLLKVQQKMQQRAEYDEQTKKSTAIMEELALKHRTENDRIAQRLNSRLRQERISFEENCRLCTFPSIKSAVWVQAISHASPLQVSFPMVTVVVEVVRKLSNSFWPVSVLRKILCIN
jgi:hypothetical protein